MNSKLFNDEHKVLCGEDPHKIPVSAITSCENNDIIADTEKAVSIWYRFRIREEFEKNSKVVRILDAYKLAPEAFEELKRVMSNIIHDESVKIFDSILQEILIELEDLKKRPASLYLVDEDGRASLALKPEHFYNPPDFVDESGNLRKSTTIVHPGLSVQLAMKKHEDSKELKFIQKHEGVSDLAIQHLKDDSVIARQTIEILSSFGIETFTFDGGQTIIEIEFGQERQEGMIQSFNPKFHRANLFANILSKRIRDELGEKTQYNLIDISLKRNSKKRWYLARVEIPST